MGTSALIEKIARSIDQVPDHAEVLELRQLPVDDLETRVKRLLGAIGDSFDMQVGRSDWRGGDLGTDVLLPGGGRARYYHESGAVEVAAGLAPMDHLFGSADKEGCEKSSLMKLVEAAAGKLDLRGFVAGEASVEFERLWSIKASAASRDGKASDTVLCRVVGAYRQFAGEIPIWGPASIALKLAEGGRFDSLALNLREVSGKAIDRPSILKVEKGARNLVQQLETLMGRSKLDLDESARVEWARFGYLSLSRRKAQTMLAPVYLAGISIAAGDEKQAYVLATAATDKSYMSLGCTGNEALPSRVRSHLKPPLRSKLVARAAAFGLER